MSAPRDPPAHLLAGYTLDDRIPLLRLYVDEADASTAIRFTRPELDECVEYAKQKLLAPRPGRAATGVNHAFVARALTAEGPATVAGAEVVVFGSTDPWVECLCVAAGAKSVLTVEWQAREYDHPLMRTLGASEFDEATREGGRFAGSFDVAIALSAFDHDGLGRYGDRLHPDGDLLAMRGAWRALRPETGRLLLSAPVGPDLVVWNLHRRYGPLRLPRLLGGWDEAARIGFDEERLTRPADHKRRFEPLFVLRRNSSADLPVDVQQCEA